MASLIFWQCEQPSLPVGTFSWQWECLVHFIPNTYTNGTKQHKKPRRKVTEVPQPSDPTEHVVDKAVNKEMDDNLERAATTSTSLDAEQDKGVNIPRSGKDSLKLNELMELCTMRVKKLERRKRSRTHGLKRLYKVGLLARVESFEDEGLGKEDASTQGRISDIDANEDIYLVNVHNDEHTFGVNDLDGDEVIVESVNVAEQAKEVVDDITLAKALMEIKSAKPKALKVMTQEPEKEQAPTPTVSSQQPSQVKDKGKGKMVKPEPVKKLSKKYLLMLDEELSFKLQAEEEEERIAREKAQQIKEVNIAWDDVQAKIDVDYELAQRLQAEKQNELTDAEKAKLFIEFLKKRRKFFATKRAKEKRNRPPTRA
nr:hypothetical protein [Tanacetum cinerariifolium]